MELFSDYNKILLHQSKYGESLESIPLEKSTAFQKHEVMSAQQKQAYRSKIGQILWTSRQSHPDVVFDACQLASKIKDGKVEHLMEAHKVIRRIKSEQVDLKIHNLGSGQLSLLVYTNASLGNLPDGGTQGGYIIFLPNDKGKVILIDPARIEPGQIITYNHMDTGTKISAKVLSKAGKATGRNKNWYNIQCLKPEDDEGERMSVDLIKVSGLELSTTEPTPTTNSDETLMIMDEVSFENAKKEELESWKENHVYIEIKDNGQRCFHQMGLYTQRNKG